MVVEFFILLHNVRYDCKLYCIPVVGRSLVCHERQQFFNPVERVLILLFANFHTIVAMQFLNLLVREFNKNP